MHFRLSHKERTAIRNSKHSWLITTAFMHTWWSRQEWNQCTNYPFLIPGKHTVSSLPQVPAPESWHRISPFAYNCTSRVWIVVDHAECSKWTTIIFQLYCMRSYASINRRRPIGHDASRGDCSTNTTLRACQSMYPCHDLGSGKCKLLSTSHESVKTRQNTVVTVCTTSLT
jgi:hypothetical protein